MEKGMIKLEFTGNNTLIEVKNVEWINISVAVHLLMEKLAEIANKDVMEIYDSQKRLYKDFKALTVEEYNNVN